jgi:transposase
MIRIRYCGRNVIERGIGWLKERRSVATRYAKLASTISGWSNALLLSTTYND